MPCLCRNLLQRICLAGPLPRDKPRSAKTGSGSLRQTAPWDTVNLSHARARLGARALGPLPARVLPPFAGRQAWILHMAVQGMSDARQPSDGNRNKRGRWPGLHRISCTRRSRPPHCRCGCPTGCRGHVPLGRLVQRLGAHRGIQESTVELHSLWHRCSHCEDSAGSNQGWWIPPGRSCRAANDRQAVTRR